MSRNDSSVASFGVLEIQHSKRAKKWPFILFGLGVFLGIGVVIGWFSKPETSTTVVENGREPVNLAIIDDFASRVDSKMLEEEIRFMTKDTRYATSQGDYEIADYLREKWADYLDDAWFVNYDIMHQYPNEAQLEISNFSRHWSTVRFHFSHRRVAIYRVLKYMYVSCVALTLKLYLQVGH